MAPRRAAKDKKPASPRKATATASKVTKRASAKNTTAKSPSPTKKASESTMATPTKKRGRPPGTTKAAKAANTAGKSKESLLFIDGGREAYLEDDPDQSTDDIVAEIGRRRLTKLDRTILASIESYENDGEHELVTSTARQLLQQRTEALDSGKPLNCHAKLHNRLLAYDDQIRAGKSAKPPPKSTPKSKAGGKSASPTKTTATRGKSASPIKTSAATRRSASKSPTKSTARGKSKSPVKDTMTRPVRQSSPTKRPFKVNKQAQYRLTKDDDYGEIMRRVEQSIYNRELYGRGSGQYTHAHLMQKAFDALEREDVDYAQAKGADRAAKERETALPEVDGVDNSGVVVNQRSAGRGSRAMTRPTVSPSPTKGIRGSQARRSPSKSPTKTAAAPPTARRSPSKSPAPAKVSAALVPLPPNQPSKEGHGKFRSPTNPEFLTKDGKPFKKNVFFETMPAREVWHRNMPSFFSFGETPYMERITSQQIEEDLNRSQEEVPQPPAERSWAKYVPTAVKNLTGIGKESAPGPRVTKDPAEGSTDKIWTMWDLPVLTEEEAAQARR